MPPTTRIRSRVLAPGGGPHPGVYVSAVLLDEPSEIRQPRPEAITGADGWWELDLIPNTQLSPGSFYRIREYLVGERARAAAVPDPPADGSAVLLTDIEIDPDTPPPDPEPEPGTSLWLYRAELGQPDGIAQLGPDRLVRPEQLPDVALQTTEWFRGNGPPGLVIGAGKGDMYLDLDTGELYQLG